MRFAIGSDGVRLSAVPNSSGRCPDCAKGVFPKCGPVIRSHWSHYANTRCVPGKEHETDWHRAWKDYAPLDRFEQKVGTKNRVDIIAYDGTFVEVQHSRISASEVVAREQVYERLLWIFDSRKDYAEGRLKINKCELCSAKGRLLHDVICVACVNEESPCQKNNCYFCGKKPDCAKCSNRRQVTKSIQCPQCHGMGHIGRGGRTDWRSATKNVVLDLDNGTLFRVVYTDYSGVFYGVYRHREELGLWISSGVPCNREQISSWSDRLEVSSSGRGVRGVIKQRESYLAYFDKPSSARILDVYGSNAEHVLRTDPYIVFQHVAEVPFRLADYIGVYDLGVPREDPRRAVSIVIHLVERAADDGHVFVELGAIENQSKRFGVNKHRIRDAIRTLSVRKVVACDEGGRVYAIDLYRAETSVACSVAAMSAVHDSDRRSGAGEAFLTDQQNRAVQASLEHSLVVITGHPGTGKTTTVKAIVRANHGRRNEVVVCGPTHRAVTRLRDGAPCDARTLHSLLEWTPGQRPGRHRANPIDADLIVVDEASMVDLLTAHHLFNAIGPNSKLVLMGDVDQLPSVRPGQVLKDVIESKAVPVVRLTKIFRQAQKSGIVEGARAIRNGRVPPKSLGDPNVGQMFIVETEDPDTIKDKICKAIHYISDSYNLHPTRDIQVITPTNKGVLGTHAINRVLQSNLNKSFKPVVYGSDVWLRPGDKVMQTYNDHDRAIFNGDFGTVRYMAPYGVRVDMNEMSVFHEGDGRDSLQLAYATTVHKVQGGEFPAVIIVAHDSHRNLSRAMLYTAVTRGKRVVVVIGTRSAILQAVRRKARSSRNSLLVPRIMRAQKETSDVPVARDELQINP